MLRPPSSPFGAVDSFLGMRDVVAGAPIRPFPEMPKVIEIPGRVIQGGAPSGGGHSPGDGHNHKGGGGGSPQWGEFESTFRGLRKTSGYRDPEHNRRVGGVPNSLHMRKDNPAHDYVGSAKEMQDAAAWARARGAREVLIHNVGSGQHLHVAW